MAGGRRRAALLALGAFFLVWLAVEVGATRTLDQGTVDRLRPDDVWGSSQARLEWIIDAFEPRRAYPFLALVAVLAGLRRHSWRPVLFSGLVILVSAAATTSVKVLGHRPDPHADVASTGGSFPSGHVAALLVCLGCCALVGWARTRWWQWVLIAIPVVAMTAALLVTAAHWATDVLGGVLLAVAILCWSASWPLRAGAAAPELTDERPEQRTAGSHTQLGGLRPPIAENRVKSPDS